MEERLTLVGFVNEKPPEWLETIGSMITAQLAVALSHHQYGFPRAAKELSRLTTNITRKFRSGKTRQPEPTYLQALVILADHLAVGPSTVIGETTMESLRARTPVGRDLEEAADFWTKACRNPPNGITKNVIAQVMAEKMETM